MNDFVCPFCKYDSVTVVQYGQSLIFCQSCNIYWGHSAEQITNTLTSPLLKHIFEKKFEYKPPAHTGSDKFWYAFSMFLVLVAALLV